MELIAEAHQCMDNDEAQGKIVVTPWLEGIYIDQGNISFDLISIDLKAWLR